jgi:hypothetical protein
MNQFLEKRTQIFTYDVTGGDSGAIATHTLGMLPANAVITQAWIHVLTTFTSAGADAGTISLGYTGATTAFDAATAISSGTTWDDAAPRVSDGAADAAVGNFIEIDTAELAVVAVTAVQIISAGKLLLVVEYYISD